MKKDFTPVAGVEGGCYRDYQNGSIYAANKTGAWVVLGAIQGRWNALGGATGFLGMPTTDETATPDGVGRYNHFAGGSIYWHPCIGAFEVHGLIRNLWASMGWEKSYLGFPKSNETPTSDGQGRYSEFQGGRVYWHPTYGTFAVSDAILRQWADRGYEKGTLGYPIEQQKCLAPGRLPCTQKFHGGLLAQDWNTVDLRGEIARRGIAIRHQGDRPTCSVHAMTFLLEYAYTTYCGLHYQNLSEEYLNHVANLATGRTDDGDFFSNILAGYNKFGVVTESQLPYQATYDYYHFNLSNELIQMGKYHIGPYAKMTGTWIREYAPTPGLSDAEMGQILP
ncbi:MAG: hypothetical protein HYX41_02420 [Bdellovibrio sp.]|nr:hypothetical protein [Bdellovibrio sp.]